MELGVGPRRGLPARIWPLPRRTASGTGLNAQPAFAEDSPPRWRASPACLRDGANKFEALASHDRHHRSCPGAYKTCWRLAAEDRHDIRLHGSGPALRASARLLLPENEPGSSIMRGQVNPTQAEALTMVATQVMGNHVTVTRPGSQAISSSMSQPVMIYDSSAVRRLIADACVSFTRQLRRRIEPNRPASSSC